VSRFSGSQAEMRERNQPATRRQVKELKRAEAEARDKANKVKYPFSRQEEAFLEEELNELIDLMADDLLRAIFGHRLSADDLDE
jgi:hypothetical protein